MWRIALLLGLAATASAQDFRELIIDRVATGYQFTEGPAMGPDGVMVFSDVPANRILRFKLEQGASVLRENSGAANGNAFDTQGRMYTCEGGSRRVTRTLRGGEVEVFADRFEGKRFNAPNDIAIRKDGQAYFTDPAFGKQADARELTFYGIFHVSPRGELDVVARMETRPNGVALAPDGKTLYVAMSDERTVRAWDLDRSGKPANGRIVISGIDGVPDGIRADSKGRLYVACRGVAIYSNEGKLLRMVEMPETPSNVEVVENGGWMVYVTARRSLYRIREGRTGPEQRQ